MSTSGVNETEKMTKLDRFKIIRDVAWGRILTCDNLVKRGYTLVGW